ncbi:hypothetical protein Q31a_18530 [Aureliella helgolandensis]|uniref:Uncharacterized protein n=1 Tax=Aureliella helgolandensis TaxID=2527968 RepID=A0A518G4M4_9BACT|nr:hypothetical protein Q31a_18530 [Aureliella helgolandensis]
MLRMYLRRSHRETAGKGISMPDAPSRIHRRRQNKNVALRMTQDQWSTLVNQLPEDVSVNQHILETLGLSTKVDRYYATDAQKKARQTAIKRRAK